MAALPITFFICPHIRNSFLAAFFIISEGNIITSDFLSKKKLKVKDKLCAFLVMAA